MHYILNTITIDLHLTSKHIKVMKITLDNVNYYKNITLIILYNEMDPLEKS